VKNFADFFLPDKASDSGKNRIAGVVSDSTKAQGVKELEKRKKNSPL
jgi:hypothetical protein